MKRSSVRAFGVACFLIGAILTIANQYNIPIITSKEENVQQYKEQIAELELQLKKANEKLEQTEQTKQNSEAVQSKETTQETQEVESSQENTIPDKSDKIVSGTLYIYSGLTSAEVAQKLKDLGVIKNSVEMELFLAQPEYAKSIQKGQFELDSSMSVEEIANIITGKPQE
ncbi:endolytic transglycosylase MltG [Lysinibacillus endophyticus]|uniref:Endolytic transglycosylase MltG n=1 Tax=Ureibacillus endophyticus TaxID=1978490 RepID=A0A494YZS7_9BACL|nr:endolytic transglycosylase MltG [Lysinibacillus endophyticus]RKQ15758.1 hypothetical protein D8M03_11185 [Lysinibacillus endophyticus]